MAEKIIELVIEGEPEAWKRAGYFRHSKGITIYDQQSKEKKVVRGILSAQFSSPPIADVVRISVEFHMPTPQSRKTNERYKKKPDIDNLQKYIFDCMNGLVLTDDALIDEVHAKKVYSEKPCTIIRLFQDEDESI